MNELTLISSVICVLPAAYIVHKIFHLNKGITQYTQQVQNLNKPEAFTTPVQSNLTLVHCQKCSEVPLPEESVQVVINQ